MKFKYIVLACACLLAGINSKAAIHRVNNTIGMSPNYTTLAAAVTAAAAGDTLFIEGSATAYGNIILSKKLVLVGTGYFLSGPNPNPQTQVNPNESNVGNLYFAPGSKGSIVQGLRINYMEINDSLVTVERCNIYSMIYMANGISSIYGDTIRNNYIYGLTTSNTAGVCRKLMIYNNIFTHNNPLNFLTQADGFVINNAFGFTAAFAYFNCQNFLFQNNLFKGADFGANLALNVFFNNISIGNIQGSGGMSGASNTVLTSTFSGPLFVDPASSSPDGRYKLVTNSVAAGAGVLNGVPVDCGPFGGPAPYILSGMPPFPSIYLLNAPAQVPSGTPSMIVNIGAAGH